MFSRFLVFAQVGINGTDIDVSASGRRPVLYLKHLKFESLFEIAEGYFRFVIPRSRGGYFL